MPSLTRLLTTILMMGSIAMLLVEPLQADSFHLVDHQNDDDDDILVSDLLEFVGLGALVGATAAVAGVASVVEPVDAKPRWDTVVIPWYEFSFNTTWTFESRSNQPLILDDASANSKRFDWTGAPGYSTRFAFQPFEWLGAEAIFDYTSSDESFRFANATGIATNPAILLPSQTVEAQRQSTIASGQINALIREHPFNYTFVGLRWWHQDDSLALRALSSGIIWFNETQTNAPFLQLGINRTLVGNRSIWANRASAGAGASWTISRTSATQLQRISADEVQFAAFAEVKTELGYSITPRLAARLGAQLLVLSSTYRSAGQIRSTDLSNGLSSPNSDALLLSSLYTGLSYKY